MDRCQLANFVYKNDLSAPSFSTIWTKLKTGNCLSRGMIEKLLASFAADGRIYWRIWKVIQTHFGQISCRKCQILAARFEMCDECTGILKKVYRSGMFEPVSFFKYWIRALFVSYQLSLIYDKKKEYIGSYLIEPSWFIDSGLSCKTKQTKTFLEYVVNVIFCW